jgi:anti-sigma B factor antagonist
MPGPDFKHVTVAGVDDVVVVELITKEVQGPAMAQQLGNEFARVTAEYPVQKVVVDFSRVKYLGSIAFAALSRLIKNVRSAGGQIKFCSMEPSVRQATTIIFGADVVGSQHSVEIYATRDAAVVSFAMS